MPWSPSFSEVGGVSLAVLQKFSEQPFSRFYNRIPRTAMSEFKSDKEE